MMLTIGTREAAPRVRVTRLHTRPAVSITLSVQLHLRARRIEQDDIGVASTGSRCCRDAAPARADRYRPFGSPGLAARLARSRRAKLSERRAGLASNAKAFHRPFAGAYGRAELERAARANAAPVRRSSPTLPPARSRSSVPEFPTAAAATRLTRGAASRLSPDIEPPPLAGPNRARARHVWQRLDGRRTNWLSIRIVVSRLNGLQATPSRVHA